MSTEIAIVSGATSPYYSEWGNFQGWLNSAQGLVFYFVVLVAILILVFLPSLRRNRGVLAILIWIGLGLAPVILAITSIPWGYFPTLEVEFVLLFAIPLAFGLFILAIPE